MSPFTIFPAIDLRNGKVVRLAQGDPGRQTTYGDDPLAWAERWQSEGAEWLHVINLSGAFEEDTNVGVFVDKRTSALLWIWVWNAFSWVLRPSKVRNW